MKYTILNSDYLAHHGVKGQKWGVRNYQNYDGTLTSKGKSRLKQNKFSKTRETQNASSNSASNYNWDSKRTGEQQLNLNNLKKQIVKDGWGYYDIYDSTTNRINKDELKRLVHDGGEYIIDDEAFRNGPLAQYRIGYGDEFADIYYEAMLENTELAKSMLAAQEEIVPQLNAEAAGMPASAKDAKQKEQYAEYEKRMKANIPASAWEQRARSLSGKSAEPIKKIVKTNAGSSGMPTSAKEAREGKRVVPKMTKEYWDNKHFNEQKNVYFGKTY